MRLVVASEDRVRCAALADRLRRLGHGCFELTSAEAVRRLLRRESFDMIVLDRTLAEGPEGLLVWLRANLPVPPPVAVVVGANAQGASVEGDAIIPWPLDDSLLESLVSGLLASRFGGGRMVETYGSLTFDIGHFAVELHGRRITLTNKEFGLALMLCRNIGRPLSRAHIMESVWGRVPDEPSRTLDAHVSQVRKRLDLKPANGFRLSSVYGFGYLLERVAPTPQITDPEFEATP